MPCGIDEAAAARAAERWDSIAKPLKGLGRLEELVTQIAGITGNENVRIGKRAVIVMCADNGIVEEGVTQTDSEVTAIVSLNIAGGTASINRMSDRAGIDVIPVDIGIAREIAHPNLRAMKAAYGTRNFLKEPAMSEQEVCRAIDAGIRLVRECREQGYELLATGEMGIGNTTTSSALIAAYLGLSAKETVGRGAGLNEEGLVRKRRVIAQALKTYPLERMSPLEILRTLGGLDLAGMAGVFMGGALYRIPVIVDGLISAAAALAAVRICPQVRPFLLASHLSREPAAEPVMKELGLSPVIDGHLALGEGTGAVLLVPMLDMALEVYRENDSFAEIGIEAYQEYEDSGKNVDTAGLESAGEIR
ncbi:nicotinate-nucleotide--dimethylbenzimidazole phosphoribosyltransferase [Lachnospiraceae bacterium ASD3451]|nr:nicotinate-nucleotide--dimethylbenzimidazole phosphoribosyltransferase [Diplocloster agilis]